VHHAVNPHAHPHFRLIRLDVDVAGVLQNRTLQNGVHQPDGGRGSVSSSPPMLLAIKFSAHSPAPASGTPRRNLPLHIRNGAGRALAAVQAGNGVFDGLGCGDHGHHALAGGGFHFLQSHKVQRIAHGEIQGIAVQPHRDHIVLPGNIFRQKLRHLRLDKRGGQVDKFDAQLPAQSASISCCSVIIFSSISSCPKRCLVVF
jgi:hypothetical protein